MIVSKNSRQQKYLVFNNNLKMMLRAADSTTTQIKAYHCIAGKQKNKLKIGNMLTQYVTDKPFHHSQPSNRPVTNR